ncbi:AVPR1A [Mytilus edulis]|uniref:AVPR1A n=1 Tax=Mytilus edulis TaxID=6550 RepID=A0A8S3QFR8_MYTED|nr:AVPR1A [Mytilus edulis]
MNNSTLYDGALSLVNNITENSNITNNTGNLPGYARNEFLAKFELAVLAFMFITAVIGNVLVIVALKCHRKKLTRMQWFIIHLCIADLSLAFFNQLPQFAWDLTYRFQGNNVLCKFVKYVQLISMYSSSYVLITTALDRYFSICYPINSQTWTIKRVHFMVSVAWLLSFAFSIPQLIFFSYVEVSPGSNEYDCWESLSNGPMSHLQAYITWIFVSIYLVPFLALVFTYGRICYVVWQSMDNRSGYERQTQSRNGNYDTHRTTNDKSKIIQPRVHTKKVSKSKIKTIKMTLIVVTCYLLCWGPFFIAQMWSVYDFTAPFTGAAMTIILLLTGLNSCANPFIFLAFSGRLCKSPTTAARTSTCPTSHTELNSETRLRSTNHSPDDHTDKYKFVTPPAKDSYL